MNLARLIKGVREKVIGPKVYAINLKHNGGTFLTVQVAYSLEDAFASAREDLKKNHPGAENIEIIQFHFRDLKKIVEMFGEAAPEPAQATGPQEQHIQLTQLPVQEEKNPVFNKLEMMQRIVRTKDRKLFNQHKSEFSEAEQKYLLEKLKSN